MTSTSIYEDIAARTGGNIYIGVVGPVRTGKSTFIKRFMETLVLPRMEDPYRRERARDELPQSGGGRTIMTAEPKFVPEEAVEVHLGHSRMRVRLIDCVGYMADGALGLFEDGQPRMVKTPWFAEEVSITAAAEHGTRKVMDEHATIGLVITTDGTVTELDRPDYLEAEARIIRELQRLGKPFLVVLNTADPDGAPAAEAARHIRETFGLSPVCCNCAELTEDGVERILQGVLGAFPVVQVDADLPDWISGLPADHAVRSAVYSALRTAAEAMHTMGDANHCPDILSACEYITGARLSGTDMGRGVVTLSCELDRSIFYGILSECAGRAVRDDGELPALIAELAAAKRSHDRYAEALRQVYDTGYGIVMPSLSEMRLAEPEIVRQGGRSGVRLCAEAPSIHMVRADIKAEISPVVGSEKQSEDLLAFLLREFEEDTNRIWDSNIFGKSLHELVNEGLQAKLNHMPAQSQEKLREAMERIINEGSSGLICIIL
ncbi:MAG: stage IV sporulation protein A [Clostridia bacterium]|nr:stage IV sporulation protein A [Clostridia bacterium]